MNLIPSDNEFTHHNSVQRIFFSSLITGQQQLYTGTDVSTIVPEEFVLCPKCGARIPHSLAIVASNEKRLSKEYETRMEKEIKARLVKLETRLKSSMEQDFGTKLQELEDKLGVKEKYLKETRDRESSLRRELLDAEEEMKN